MRIAVVTIYNVRNYGSVLQAFATQKVVEAIGGGKCEIVRYQFPNEWQYQHGMQRPNLRGRLGISRYMKRDVSMDLFRWIYYQFTRRFRNLDELRAADWSQYNVVVAGSDQIWNYKFTNCDSAYMLSFVPDNIKKIAVSSSFAVDSIPEAYRPKMKTYLQRFEAISVREANGIQILQNDLHIPGSHKVLLDPTLLLSRKQWMQALHIKEKRAKKPYILFYCLGYAFNPYPTIYKVTQHLAKKMGIHRVLVVSGDAKATRENTGLEVKDCNATTVKEFVRLFCQAALVVTSSFHGTSFAINFGCPLAVVAPENGDDRMTTLLNRMGLSQCKVPSIIEDVDPFYDKAMANQRLNELRNDSLAWIRDQLNP